MLIHLAVPIHLEMLNHPADLSYLEILDHLAVLLSHLEILDHLAVLLSHLEMLSRLADLIHLEMLNYLDC